MSDNPHVLTEVRGRVGLITLNKPEKLNAWDTPMRMAVKAALEKFNADKAVRAIILTGSGDRAFCAGQDLSETKKFSGASKNGDWFASWRAFYDAMRLSSKPIIAALNGVAAASELRNHSHHVTSVQQAPEQTVFASPEAISQAEAHQYHGGPKAND